MSIRTMARVWERSRHSGSELLMLLAIADFADDDGNAYPAVGTLATKCRMTPRNANLILASLRKSGELVVKLNEGPKGTNLYHLPASPTPEAGFTPEELFTLKPTSPTPEAGFTPEELFTLKPTSPTPEAGFPKPLKPASDEPSVNHQEPSVMRDAKKTRRVCSPSASESVADGFAEFWKQYPRKVAKPQALKSWSKLKPTGQTLVDLMAGLQRQKATEQWQKDGGRYIPHPATWLNGRRWEDEQPVSPTVPTPGTSTTPPKPGDTRMRFGVHEVFDDCCGWVPA